MANDEVLGPRKTMFVLVIVVGCFAVLWPRILSPLILGHTQEQLKPNKFDREAGCCEVIFQTDVAILELVNEVCNSALGVSKPTPQSAAECRKAVNESCGVDIAAFLKRDENVGKSTKKLVEALKNTNSSCLREHFGVPIYSLSPHSPVNSWTLQDSLKQERPLRAMSPHPALRERGRAIPPTAPARQQMPPHVRVRSPLSVYLEIEPPPIPGMRPPLGSPGGPVTAPKSSMGFVMPIYTICIIVFFVYTLSKILFKRTGVPYEPVTPDPQFRRRVFRDDSRTTPDKLGHKEADTRDVEIAALRARLEETERAMQRIVGQLAQRDAESQDNHTRPYTNGTILVNSGPVQIVTSEYQEPKANAELAKSKENLSERKESSSEKELPDDKDSIHNVHDHTKQTELTPIHEETVQTKESTESNNVEKQSATQKPQDTTDINVSQLEQTQSSKEQEESSTELKEHNGDEISSQFIQKEPSPEQEQLSDDQVQPPSLSSIGNKEPLSEPKESSIEQEDIPSKLTSDLQDQLSSDACVDDKTDSESSLQLKESSIEQEGSLNKHEDSPQPLLTENYSLILKEASIDHDSSESPIEHIELPTESIELESIEKETSVEPKETSEEEELSPDAPLVKQKKSESKEASIEKELTPDPYTSLLIQKETSLEQESILEPKDVSTEEISTKDNLESNETSLPKTRSSPVHESLVINDDSDFDTDDADKEFTKEPTPITSEEELDISDKEDKPVEAKEAVIKENDEPKELSKQVEEITPKKPESIDVKQDAIVKTEKFLKEERDVATKDGPTTPELLAEALKEDSPVETVDNENSSVKIMGMEVTAHPADGSAMPARPPLASHPPALPAHKAEDVKSIFLETEIPQQSRVLVADFQDTADAQKPTKNAPLVVSGKMTLSLIQDAPRDSPERDPESTITEYTTASAMTQPAAGKDDDLSEDEIEEEIEEEEEEIEELEEEEEEIELGGNKTGLK
ncbi:eukaryotic translation initiation factor 5B isoform X3 [Colias croceus]|uniref:eukaryotic translation initiation factor 5B isoform X3 n=1 Tax=Colias crocea TaxID=72248 RepID=UPI001E279D7B|nr:eukaryotic translation initiation factor 5B isoform X3 [Colias croceus]